MTGPSQQQSLSLESLKSEIDFLAAQLAKSSRVVADTGRRVLAMEIDNEKRVVNSLDPPKIPGVPNILETSKGTATNDVSDIDNTPQKETRKNLLAKNLDPGVDSSLLRQSNGIVGAEDIPQKYNTPSQSSKSTAASSIQRPEPSLGHVKPKDGHSKDSAVKVSEGDLPVDMTTFSSRDLTSNVSTDQAENDEKSSMDILSKLMELTNSKDLTTNKPKTSKKVSFEAPAVEETKRYDFEEEEENPELDYVTGDDIVELVTELQGQLDLIENRSIRRQANGFAINDDDAIAPLASTDGSIPNESFTVDVQSDGSASKLHKDGNDEEPLIPTVAEYDESLYYLPGPFPRTFGEFKALSPEAIGAWCKFYELLPPDDEEIQQLLSAAGTTLESLGGSYEMKISGKGDAKDVNSDISKKQSDKDFDTLARFLGLRARRTKGAW